MTLHTTKWKINFSIYSIRCLDLYEKELVIKLWTLFTIQDYEILYASGLQRQALRHFASHIKQLKTDSDITSMKRRWNLVLWMWVVRFSWQWRFVSRSSGFWHCLVLL